MTENQEILSPAAAAKRVGLSQTAVRRLRYKGQFPLPVRLSEKRLGYLRHEVDAWLQTRIAERPVA